MSWNIVKITRLIRMTLQAPHTAENVKHFNLASGYLETAYGRNMNEDEGSDRKSKISMVQRGICDGVETKGPNI